MFGLLRSDLRKNNFLLPPVNVNSSSAIYTNCVISERNYGCNLSIWETQITLCIIFRVYYILFSYLSWNFFESTFLPLRKENFHKMFAALKACRVPLLKQTKHVRKSLCTGQSILQDLFAFGGTEYNLHPDRVGGQGSALKWRLGLGRREWTGFDTTKWGERC